MQKYYIYTNSELMDIDVKNHNKDTNIRNVWINIKCFVYLLKITIDIKLKCVKIKSEIMNIMKTIVGITGSFGSGCSYIAKEYIIPHGYKYISLSQILRDKYNEQNEILRDNTIKKGEERQSLQDFGDEIRKNRGASILAELALEKIEADAHDKWVVDSIRNPEEITYLKKKIGKFYLFGIFADFNTRWNRYAKDYDNDQRLFLRDDERDKNEPFIYGQRVTDCFILSDFIMCNNDEVHKGNEADHFLSSRIKYYIDLIEGNTKFDPTEIEAIMSMAYANSLRSSCLQRKVGAIIIDDFGNIISSGYNEVPKDDNTCKEKFGKCYRRYLRDDFEEQLEIIVNDQVVKNKISSLYKSKFKNIDYCRSLHAEENAILNIARVGSSKALKDATLYTTTYPCNLCANKIVQVGIRNVVYIEPYPMKEAKEILDKNRVNQQPFIGVLFNGYFRFLEVRR